MKKRTKVMALVILMFGIIMVNGKTDEYVELAGWEWYPDSPDTDCVPKIPVNLDDYNLAGWEWYPDSPDTAYVPKYFC